MKRVEVMEAAVTELRALLIDRAPFDFLRFVQRVKPLFEDETLALPAPVAERMRKLQEAVYVVCMGFAGDNQIAALGRPKISWAEKEEFILAELQWLEALAAEWRATLK